jgi:predicted metal-dependent hydrolase
MPFFYFVKRIRRVRRIRKTLKGKRSEYLDQKEHARKLVQEKLDHWKKFYLENFGIHFVWRRVAIKNSKTRWGSCSSQKNLNFSYKILTLSPEGQDYLIVHELCHLIQMNHSKNFWDLVGLGIPNYKKLRKNLRGIG